MKELKKIDVLSLGKIHASLSGIWGLIVAIVSFIGAQFIPTGETSSSLLAGGLQLIVIAVVAGFFLGVLIAVFYNIIAKKFGGVKINLS